jgi:hypothetical protein
VLARVVKEAWAFVVKQGSHQLMAVQFFFAEDDARRDYLIVYQPAGNCRPGGCWAGSLRDAVKRRDLDLRRPDDVRGLEEELTREDLDKLKAKLKARLAAGGPRDGEEEDG